jgi:[ribosomal protein S18]-alanine N-acetyltransferase
MLIRPYTADDRVGCLGIFRSNVPLYFVADDEPEFVRFIDQKLGLFCVVSVESVLVACGGTSIDYPELGAATLCWGMVSAGLHRRGIGRALLVHRIKMVTAKYPTIRRLRLNTTQKAQAFFELHGFRVTQVDANGYGVGLDRVSMECELTY